MTGESKIPYEEFMQDALRGVVRRVLARTMEQGLPGGHHFYIAFKTRAPGVVLPPWLLEKYPDEMTIVVQHRFWDLQVHDDRFEIGLSFNQKAEHLVIPFAAMIGFVDPSVQFGLQFQEVETEATASLPATAKSAVEAQAQNEVPKDPSGPGGPKVVALDAFRKKP
ncbi:MAG: SspB family protein [Pseudomonadota bacterium]